MLDIATMMLYNVVIEGVCFAFIYASMVVGALFVNDAAAMSSSAHRGSYGSPTYYYGEAVKQSSGSDFNMEANIRFEVQLILMIIAWLVLTGLMMHLRVVLLARCDHKEQDRLREITQMGEQAVQRIGFRIEPLTALRPTTPCI